MKPATVQEEFIPFQQLMNICSALVVTVLWSVGAVRGSTDNAESSGAAVCSEVKTARKET